MTAGVVVRLSVDGEPMTVTSGPEALDQDALEPLCALLRPINEALVARGSDWRFVVGSGPAEGDTNFGYRLALLPVGAAEEVAALDWAAAGCLPDSARAPDAPSAPPPRLRTIEERVGQAACFDEDPGYPALLAAYVERLAAFAGVRAVRCRPSPSLAEMFGGDSFFSLQLDLDA